MKIDYSYHYRKWHSDTPEHAAQLTAHYLALLGPYLPESKSIKILDVGCGMGFCLHALREGGFTDLTGIDMDEGQVASCRAKGLQVTLVEDSIAYLENNPGKFDFALALDVIEHVPVDAQIPFVSAIGRALKPGGRFVCTVPNANSVVAGRYRHIDWTHTTSFTEHSLDFVLHHGGFGHIQVEELEKIPPRPSWWWLPVSGSRYWWALRLVRLWRRTEMMAEIGPGPGRLVPLSPNLIAIADKRKG